MRELLRDYFDGRLSRRGFLHRLVASGFTAAKRGIQATKNGNPYLVEVVVSRTGEGADSTWHQKFNLAAQRTKLV